MIQIQTDITPSNLRALKEGRLTVKAFEPKRCPYVRQMARWIHGKSAWANPSLEIDDLEQIAFVTIWRTVERYRYRCVTCRRAARSASQLEQHVALRHPGATTDPAMPIGRYVHGCVGQALWHAVRPFMRRAKWDGGELPETLVAEDTTQQDAAELAFLVAAARVELGPIQARVIEALAAEQSISYAGSAELREFLMRRIG